MKKPCLTAGFFICRFQYARIVKPAAGFQYEFRRKCGRLQGIGVFNTQRKDSAGNPQKEVFIPLIVLIRSFFRGTAWEDHG